jgi:kynurenine formamidase
MQRIHEIAKKVSNWGRWGAEDERGTLNFITADKIREAAACVKQGTVFSLGLPFGAEGPQIGQGGRVNPMHVMSALHVGYGPDPEGFRYNDDLVVMPLQCATQWDSLAHIFDDGKMYNGYDAALVTSSGAAKNSIDKTKSKIAGRGVLLDVARYKGVRALEPGYAITVADLEGTAAAAKVEVQRGDILLVRTGHMSRYLDKGDWKHFDLDPFPGVSVHTAPWLHARQIAAIASDNYAVEVRPSEIAGFRNPFHVVAIPNMGLTLGEIFFLEELAEDCAKDGRYAFLLVAPPLPVTGGVGTPINPYAIK